MRRVETLIIGAGLSGISTAYHLRGRDFLVVEKSDHPGGLCTSEHKNGYTFDQTGHWLHLSKDWTKELFYTLFPEGEYAYIARKTFVFSHGVYTLYPFQSNTYGLPPEVIKECIIGFVKAQYEADKSKAKENFYEWCMAWLGEGISKHFMIPYNSKIYTVHPREMASHWCDYYVPKPKLEEVIEGAVTAPERKVGYNAHFWYPAHGGIGELVNRLYARCEQEKFIYKVHPVAIDPEQKIARLSDGSEIAYTHLVSSAPLKDFLKLLQGAFTAKAQEVAARLRIASVSYLNAALKKPLKHPGHWFYIPEEKFMPYRLGSFSNIYAPLSPAGTGSAYIEYTHRGPLADTAHFEAEGTRLMIEMGLINGNADVDFIDYRIIENGYVIFHDEYFNDINAVTAYLQPRQIHSIGRYGRWTYNAMENAIIDGRETAEKIAAQHPQ